MTDPRDLSWLAPALVALPNGRLQRGLAVAIDPDQGLIARVEPLPHDATRVTHLPQQALLPGFVNAHSHTFQRALRGRTEHLAADQQQDDFWSWRDLMYRLANTSTPDTLYDVACDLYHECLAAGFTTLGEFHYLHHDPSGAPYPDPHQNARALLAAAQDTGLRLTLLPVLYAAAGFDKPPSHAQRRFIHHDTHAFLQGIDRLLLDAEHNPLLRVGLAPHSVRAVPFDTLQRLAPWADERRLPLHIHACEQPAEVRECKAHYGVAPVQLLQRAGLLNDRLTLVHATWLEPDDPQRIAQSGATVCACPSTEANLGDGALPALDLLQAQVPLCIGSDSHIAVNPFEELRLIEYNERIRLRRRNVLAGLNAPQPSAPQHLRIAPGLLRAGALHGARALGWSHGEIAPGHLADLVALNLDAPALRRIEDDHLPEAIVFSADTAVISQTWVHGAARLPQRA